MRWYVVASPIRSARRFLYWPEMVMGHEGIEPAKMDEPIANFGWDWFKYMPDYLKDLNASFPLLALIHYTGWRIQAAYNGVPGNWVIISGPSSPVASDTADKLIVNGRTLSEAICETFLRAKGLWNSENAPGERPGATTNGSRMQDKH